MGLPFSTFRRHLTQGVDRVVAWLWDQEVYGQLPLSSTGQRSGLETEQPLGAASIEEVAAMNRQVGDHAVVVGASMAGLLAARVLADSYGQVTLIDRDELPETPEHRHGVPHGRHIHALAARGQQALEELFPGLTAELVAHGAPAGDLLADARFYLSGHRLRRTPSGLVLLCASRPTARGSRSGPVARTPQPAPPRPLRRRRSGHHARMVAASPGCGCCVGPTAAPKNC